MENLDLLLTADLLNDVFDPKTSVTLEYLEWQYRKNPAGSACVGYLHEQGKQISNYALIPKFFKNHLGEKITLGLGVDLAVSPNSRGKGLFRKTIEKSYEAGIDGNLDGILGIANSQSSPRMTGAMGWRKLQPLDLKLLKLSKSAVDLKTFRMGFDQFKQSEAKEVFDFETLSLTSGFSPIWNSELLAWRLSRPGSDYYLHVSESAFLVSTKVSFGGLKIAVLLKALPINSKETLIPIAPFAAGIAKYHRTPFITYWGKNQHFEMNGIKVPRKLQPSPLDLVVYFFEKNNNFLLNEFELLDFDAF
jgi:hypothetical protein